MFTQLPEEKKDFIKPLYKKHQPNWSALSCYFEGKMPGKAYVDDINAPTKAICRLEMSWTYASDNADLPWIEEVLGQLVKTTWACDKDNVESDRLAQRLGYVNPLEYEFVYLEPTK